MTTPTNRILLIEQLGEFLQSLEGHFIQVTESLSHDISRGHDRHCSTRTSFQFGVERVMWTISGGNFMVLGKEPFQYSISTGQLHSVTITDGEAIVGERFESKTERMSTLNVITK